MWIVRKEVIFYDKNFDKLFLLMTFTQRLTNRLHADFRRLGRASFPNLR